MAAAEEHPNKVAFQEGVTYIFKSWTALRLAVEQDWGGVDSAEKRDWMINLVVDYFGKHGKKVDVEEMEAILDQIMTDEFNALLEDDSPYLVAKHLVELYHQCIHGNFSEVERLRAKYQNQQPTTSTTASSVRQPGDDSEDDDDDDDDGDQEGEEAQDDNDMDVDDDDDDGRGKQEPLIDEDGFQTVTYRRRK